MIERNCCCNKVNSIPSICNSAHCSAPQRPPGNIVKQYLHKIENRYSQPPPHLEQSLGRVKCIVLMAGNFQNSFKTQFRIEIERYKTI